ncbi:LuxR family transcriptional regulator [Streptomyces microflavus]|uniref:Helix-turn-helix transcriptional regulator n=1 Tax=Streptomyces microflavus TaxID=1919 RepID=A0A6N9VA33_STRMI|nr:MULTISPECIES: helix-turn-helix transcriptional regulator [Streptomyces]NEE61703.1 helix-turn-helix transcriptional regulator [Streptomyces sp. SID8455]MBW3356959.1 helix-turn-helix transcriptional regulator [Streptomyces sp. 09ZI22]NEB69553.1 helix-turn-helix transcriptional regulator [Streptomyces microflavus]QKW41380.1 helix-turn-helix transcriptional regulator [Streptomyces microflavus]QQZ52623.1 helix-turn-helix transcriptional regulator [Streptomyces microflavus]
MSQPLGLDDLTHAVYRFALGRPGCSPEDLFSGLGAPRDDIRRSVDRLLELSLLRPLGGTLVPAKPSLALRTLLQQRQAEIMSKQQEFADIKDAVDQLAEEYEVAQPSTSHSGWERLESQAAVLARMERLAGRATVGCMSLLPAETVEEEALLARRPLDQHMLERGLSVWNIHLESVYNDRAALGYARWLARDGGRVGTVPTLPMWLVVYDRTTALVPIDPRNPAAGAVQVSGAGFLAGLVALFERLCETMRPLDSLCGGDAQDRPTPMEKEILRLMGQGLTDDAVRKKLGVGLRTARRMIADLMERLDARSRFEAGANAVDRGWLRPCACADDRPLPSRETQPSGSATGTAGSPRIVSRA